MNCKFDTYEDFVKEYTNYRFDKCEACGGIREIVDTDVNVEIDEHYLHFPSLLVLRCKKCGRECLPEHSKQMVDGAYKNMIEQGQTAGQFISKNYKKRFEYCNDCDYSYDHRDYYNIPGLCYDEEHSIEGFLTPVYFDRKGLIYFVQVPDYEVNIFSETYGNIGKPDSEGIYPYEWIIPFGFNNNGKLVFWLGDLDDMDAQSRAILKGFNVESDHLLIDSEFYQAQMKCIFSEPIKETQILNNKDFFIENVKKKYGIDLAHLDDECTIHAINIQRPLVYTEQSVSGVINAFDKVLVEGFDVVQLLILYESMYKENVRPKGYNKWQSIRLIKEILIKFCENTSDVDIEKVISPLYILHDYRIYLDHLLPLEKQEETKKHIVETLDVNDFSEQKKIYNEEINRLNKLFQYLVLLSK